MEITLEIRRYDRARDESAYFDRFCLDAKPTDRILDALVYIKRFQDGTLAFRKSCAHGVCGSDAMRINGKERLACKTLIQDVVTSENSTIRLEPLQGFPVEKDLMINQESFFHKYRSVKPFLINEDSVEEKERIQSQKERSVFDNATNCILCAACYSACPVMDKRPTFLGPAAIVQAARFLDDSRDHGFEARLTTLDDSEGVWPCKNHFECTRNCPRGIRITKRINETKSKIKKHHEELSARNKERGRPV